MISKVQQEETGQKAPVSQMNTETPEAVSAIDEREEVKKIFMELYIKGMEIIRS